MGRRFTTLPLAALTAFSLATGTLVVPALAQEEAATPPPSLPRAQPAPAPTQRQGPELDVYRDTPGSAPAQVAPPPITTTTPPPVVAPTPVPRVGAPAPTTPRPRPERAPATATPPAEPKRVPPTARPTSAETPSPTAEPAQPAAEPRVVPQASPAPAPSPSKPETTTPWGWILGALGIVLAGGIALFLRGRRGGDASDEQQDDIPVAPPPQRPQAPPAPAAPTRRPPPAPAPDGPRAWVDIDLTIDSARYSLAGVSIGYRLSLRNRGKAAASDMLIHALIGNADANQNELLRAFFAGTKGMPVHSVVEIAPGQTQVLTNELRLEPGAIEPLELDGRLLLVPLIGFDVHYRWDASGAPGSGRSGSAFIVGQEQVPPTERLAPFRYDQGPRQYRDIGCRRTALSLAS